MALSLILNSSPTFAAFGYKHVSGARDNDRSWLYDYDNLSRLTRADRGELSGSLTVITDPPSSHARGYQWALDPLGNWAGGAYVGSGAPGLAMSGIPDGSGGYQTVGITHATDAFNALTGITTKVGTNSPTTAEFGVSQDGAVAFEPSYIYQYDMFGRLVQVNARESNGDMGPWVKHYTYDALGRLIRTQTPYPATFGLPLAFTEHYYYDGARRIQEVATGVQLSEDGKPVYVKDELSIQTVISRDYVWDPDGGDSLIAQFDAANDLWFVISSLSGDAAALMSESGSIVAQYAFDSYGNVLDTDTLAPHSPLWIGHKGLFFDRLDQPLSPQRLAAGAEGHYHNRARTYAPKLGRFMQADPNASGLPVTGELAWMGVATWPGLLRPDVVSQYGPGAGLHGYTLCNPTNYDDPTGLFAGLLGPTSLADIQQEWIDNTLNLGRSVMEVAVDMLIGYAMDQALDWQWAMDMSMPDDMYSGSAAAAMGTGSWARDSSSDNSGRYGGPAMAGARWPRGTPSWLKKMPRADNGRGVYIIIDRSTNKVARSGRSISLNTRGAAHAAKEYTPDKYEIRGFRVTGKNQRRGIAQRLNDTFKPANDKIRDVSPRNSNRETYDRAAQGIIDFVNGL